MKVKSFKAFGNQGLEERRGAGAEGCEGFGTGVELGRSKEMRM